MPRNKLPNPRLTFWKAIYSAIGMWSIFIFMNWMFKFLWVPDRYVGFHSDPPTFPPLLTRGGALMGIGWLLLFLLIWWAWRPRRKYARWYRWVASFGVVVYVSFLVLLGGMFSWNTALATPWNLVVNSLLVVLFIFAIMLPALSGWLATKVAKAQDDLGWKMLSYGAPATLLVLAGSVGANYSMYASQHGKMTTAVFIVALGLSLVAIFVAQYNAQRLWNYRPWQKEDE